MGPMVLLVSQSWDTGVSIAMHSCMEYTCMTYHIKIDNLIAVGAVVANRAGKVDLTVLFNGLDLVVQNHTERATVCFRHL